MLTNNGNGVFKLEDDTSAFLEFKEKPLSGYFNLEVVAIKTEEVLLEGSGSFSSEGYSFFENAFPDSKIEYYQDGFISEILVAEDLDGDGDID